MSRLKFNKCPRDFVNGFAIVTENDGTVRFIDKLGNYIPGKFVKAENFNEGYAVVVKYDNKNKVNYSTFITPSGRECFGKFRYARGFENGFAIVANYDDDSPFQRKFLKHDGTFIPGKFRDVKPFNEGFALVKNLTSGDYYFIDEFGNRLNTKHNFKSATPFKNGFSIVDIGDENDRKLLKNDGTYLIEGLNDSHGFENGYAPILLSDSNKWQFVDKNGNITEYWDTKNQL